MAAVGIGKSTLLTGGCIDVPTSGRVEVDGRDVSGLGTGADAVPQGEDRFIFHPLQLIPVLNVYENIDFSLLLTNGHPERTPDR